MNPALLPTGEQSLNGQPFDVDRANGEQLAAGIRPKQFELINALTQGVLGSWKRTLLCVNVARCSPGDSVWGLERCMTTKRR